MAWPKDAYVGQKISRYRNGANPDMWTERPLIGEVVTVSKVELAWSGIRIYLSEYPTDVGYNSLVFKPVVEKPTDISIFTALLNPVKESLDA